MAGILANGDSACCKVMGFATAQPILRLLKDPLVRKESVDQFLKCVFKNQRDLKHAIGQSAFDILDELGYDLNYFVADPVVRGEDPSYYGDERLETVIKAALRRLSQIGVTTPEL
jgi:hypothetical protein